MSSGRVASRWSVRSVLAAAGLMLVAGGVHAESAGEELYLHHCGVCHQPDGKGIPGIFPPLAGNPVVKAEEAAGIRLYLGRVIFGYHGGLIVDHQVYSGRMPPIGYRGRLTDSELLDLINYQRNAWGNAARPVSIEELDAARSAGRP